MIMSRQAAETSEADDGWANLGIIGQQISNQIMLLLTHRIMDLKN
ncbi:hypothetical protein GPAL_0524 [Glaciecola pallidula DSM 14239 = ACAM 615]|jgi:hypothetical protein|uniref:Uncharacterized protein n=1 Tax=Brumicola pallidula DSM 14239 = ACAM 615 TaxID=1121922 RepID=K6Y3N8_9ALTE|nr:hypothetical protein GPAL_0524 [Glaciecola pallidula DSM 14239 = ACAM 615]